MPTWRQPPSAETLAIAAEIGRLVHEGRRRSGLTQMQLARRAGLSQSSISRLEHGLQLPSSLTLYRLAAALGGLTIGRD
jgi:transcriptional regulator with XRE-family HTH domain